LALELELGFGLETTSKWGDSVLILVVVVVVALALALALGIHLSDSTPVPKYFSVVGVHQFFVSAGISEVVGIREVISDFGSVGSRNNIVGDLHSSTEIQVVVGLVDNNYLW